MTRYHLGIVITGILCCLGPTTMIFNTWSIFMVPVSDALGVGTGAFSVMPSLIFLTCVVAAPLGGKLMDKFDARLVLTGACVLASATIFCCGFMTELWQLYLAGILEGLAGVILMFLMLPTMVNRWFAKNVATVIGICVCMTGVGGAIWVMLGGVIIVAADWRMAYMAFGVIALVMSAPATLFLVRSYPEDRGVKPYGIESLGQKQESHLAAKVSDPTKGVSAKIAFRSPSFILLVLSMSLLNGALQVGNMLPTYVYWLGDTGALVMEASALVIASSTVGLCLQAAQAFGKVSLGFVSDRNVTLAYGIALVSGLVSLVCVKFGCGILAVVYMGGVLYGIFYAVVDILTPAMSREFFGSREYTKIYARIASFINIVPAFSTAFFGTLSSISWDLTFGVVAVIQVSCLIMGLLAVKFSKNLPHTSE